MIKVWNLTNECNMKCKYCFRKRIKELDTKEGKIFIDESVKAGIKVMIFSGGEPLVRKDIYELIEYAFQSGIHPLIRTNGTLITKGVAERLKESGAIGVGIGLDSLNPRRHDEFRSFRSAWVEAVKGMKNCKEVGLPFQINTTVMKWNREEVLNITNFAVELGASAHNIFLLDYEDSLQKINSQLLTLHQYEKLFKDILIKQGQVDIELKIKCSEKLWNKVCNNNRIVELIPSVI